jgi:hypothetical protein
LFPQNENDFMPACPTSTITGCQFTQLLVDQLPFYDDLILEDVRPTDGWINHVDTGEFPAASGVQHTLDRFNHVWPNVTKRWVPTVAGNCLGTPCDKTEHQITWGATRLVYSLEEISWATPLLCFDQLIHITKAKENFRYIISDILKPATSAIYSNHMRKKAAELAGKKWIANRNFGTAAAEFTFVWVQSGDAEIYIDTNANPANVFKLTPQMLQQRFQPLIRLGYLGKQPFKDMPPNIELVSDMDTVWELDHLGGQQGIGGTPSIAGNWRFTQWDDTSRYWKYGFSGTIGNYVTRVDPFNLRFNFVGVVGGLYRYQIVLPYVNVPSSGAGGAAGLKDVDNPSFDRAQFRFSYIWHRKAMQSLVAQTTQISPEMPFGKRNFMGNWQFVMDNLGEDINGRAIENKRRNKGQFIADFQLAVRPMYTEFLELIFHKGEPQCIIEISPCAADPGYPAQVYSSDPTNCTNTAASYTLSFTPVLNPATSTYDVEASSIQCMGNEIPHAEISGAANLTTLVAQLNATANELGTWSVLNATQIRLVGGCSTVSIPWLQ